MSPFSRTRCEANDLGDQRAVLVRPRGIGGLSIAHGMHWLYHTALSHKLNLFPRPSQRSIGNRLTQSGAYDVMCLMCSMFQMLISFLYYPPHPRMQSHVPTTSASLVGYILVPSLCRSINSSFLPQLQYPSFIEIVNLSSASWSRNATTKQSLTQDLEQLPS